MLLAAVLLSTGAINPSCTPQLACTPNYTKSIRPSASYTNRLKARQMQEWGLPGDPSNYEEDHYISLELCGCATCEDNLWPEPWPEARQKDKDETRLHRQMCKELVTLEQAQEQLKAKWKIHQ